MEPYATTSWYDVEFEGVHYTVQHNDDANTGGSSTIVMLDGYELELGELEEKVRAVWEASFK